MVRQRVLNIAQSVRIGRLWFSLLGINAGNITWNYWTIDNAALVQLCEDVIITELIDWPPPYVRSPANLKILLTVVKSYLSKGNFEIHLDQWLNLPVVGIGQDDPVGGGLNAERDALIAHTVNCENSSVSAMVMKSREILLAIEYQEQKYKLSEDII